jgi:transposase InsO family protein
MEGARSSTPPITLLGSNNYEAWAYKCMILMKKEKSWKTITGTKPQDDTEWEDLEAKAMSTISSHIHDNQVVHIKSAKTPKEAWNSLKEYYRNPTTMGKVRLITKLVNTRLEGCEDIREHLAKLTAVFDELEINDQSVDEEFKIGFIFGSLPNDYYASITAMTAWEKDRLKLGVVRQLLIEEYEKIKKTRIQPEAKRLKSEVRAIAKKPNGYSRKSGSTYQREWKKKLEEPKENDSLPGGDGKKQSLEKYSIMFLLGEGKRKCWLLDSGATVHMCNDIEQFLEMKDYFSGITTANGTTIYSKGIGSVDIHIGNDEDTEPIHLRNVLYVPELDGNVVSVRQLTNSMTSIQFIEHDCYITIGNTSWKIAEWNGRLYEMCERKAENVYTVKEEGEEAHCIHEWHRKLAHRNLDDIRKMRINITDCKCSDICESCIKGKLSRKSFPKQATPVQEPLDVIVSDVCGPLQTETMGRKRYFVTFTDIYSGYTDVQLIRGKNEVAKKCINFIEMLKTQIGRKPKIFRSDRGKEYLNGKFQEYLTQEGIRFECTVGYAPEQNGISERKNRTLMEAVRSMLAESKMLKNLWGEAVNAANYVFNRIDNKKVGITPFEMLFKKKPSVLKFYEFGSDMYAMIPYEKRKKLDDKAIKARFVGYDENSKGYRLITRNNKLIISREVKSVEDSTEKSRKRKLRNPAEKQKLSRKTSNKSAEHSGEEYVEFHGNHDVQEENEHHFDITGSEHQLDMTGSDESSDGDALDDDQDDNEPQVNDIIGNDSSQSDESFADAVEHLGSEEEPEEAEEEPPEEPRRSARNNIGSLPQRYNDYKLYKAELDDDLFEPRTYLEAISCKEGHLWKQAMQEEIQSLEDNQTWELAEPLKGRRPVGSKWVFKIKDDGETIRRKARLVAQGFSQKFGINYDEVFAPVVKTTTLRLLLSIAGKRKYVVRQYDVKTAFLNGKLEEEIYMRQPPGYSNGSQLLRLRKSIYGLKQAAKVWNDTLNDVLLRNHFERNEYDKCLYAREHNNTTTYVLVHVDDILATGDSEEELIRVMTNVGKEFDIKDLGNIKHYLGMDVERDRSGNYLISQGRYIDKMVEAANLVDGHHSKYPMDPGYYKLEGKQLDSNDYFRKLIGMLLFAATHTRPDISASVGILSKRIMCPRDVDLLEAKRIIKYLKGSRNLKLRLSHEIGNQDLHAFSDANWAEDRTDRKSNSGYLCVINGGVISWCSRKQETVATSSAESELIALTDTCKEVKWLKRIAETLKETTKEKVTVYTDSQSCIAMVKNEKYSNRTKHIDTKYHYVRELYTKREIELEYVNTEVNTADLLTKPLAGTRTTLLRKLAGLVTASGGVLDMESATN